MNALLDTLGASVTGGLILLMVFGAIMNMQALSYNMQQQMILSELAENLLSGRIIGGISYSGLESYLSKVGAGVPSGIDPIIEATSSSFKFRGQLTTTSSVSTFYILTETAVNSSYPLYVYINDMSNPVLGPFWMATPLNITYYDVNNTAIASPGSNLNSIRSAKFDFNFSFETYRSDIDKRLVRYPTVIWKYFKNLYL
ncbi:MAG: hypothetical protein K9N09_06470 [Candidatus Cloacimonetes bacterium]|nr:hypothetical protein [Candidatus Cloacimonadota bacterium]MCF7813651.1 hypothetical protein [Candidatus Cloacimonadota bacterium]MCF7868330.1 hypothetical protein [Candidatus Cloacimonadota bacterium]MCF7883804.1 hypothetical protein [Candidatus Cloacimonadota bacterium]